MEIARKLIDTAKFLQKELGSVPGIKVRTWFARGLN
jgi:hypothetical protein